METRAKIDAIRQRIIQADTESALRELLAWLESSALPLKAWADTVRSLKARYRRTKQAKQKGTISFEQAQLGFSQVENDLLEVLRSLEHGELPVTAPAATPTPSTPWLTIGVVTALVLAVASFFLIRGLPNDNDNPELPASLGECPTFPTESQFNIMVLPYKPLRGEQETIESSIKDRLSSSIESYRIPAYVMTREIDVSDANLYPSDAKGARLVGDPCRAQLVIWGTTERTTDDQLITTTSFRFLNKEHFNLTNFTLDQNAEVDTLETISSVATEGILTENIEAGIRLIFGLVAHETGQHAIAANLIQEACDSLGGVTKNPKWGLVLADSYVRSDQSEEAIATFDAIVASGRASTDVLVQRGYLSYELGAYAEAEADFSEVLAQDTSNTQVRAARAAARVRTNQLYEARQDLDILDAEGHQQAIPKGVEMEYKQRHETLEQEQMEAKEQLERNPRDTAALNIQARTAQQLGDFETAKSAATRLLNRDPNRIDALTTLIKIKPMLEDTEEVHQLIERTQSRLPENERPQVRPLSPPTRRPSRSGG